MDDVNAQLDAMAVLREIDFHADKAQQTGDTIKAFCPVHKDSRFRSLLVDPERHAYRCTVKTCRGYGGGSLLELHSLAMDIPVLRSACELAQKLDLPLGDGWLEALTGSYLDEARAAKSRGDLTEAESLLTELAELAPDLTEARVMLANLHRDMGNPQAAADELIRIIDDELDGGNHDRADALVKDALAEFPDNEDVQFASVRVAESAENEPLAIERMLAIIQLRETENRQMDNIGLLEQLVQKAPDKPELAIKLGGLYEQQHNVRAASRQYEAAATHYTQAGETEAAIQWLEKVVQFNSENSHARLDLAQKLADTGEFDKARDHTFRVINQNIDQQEFGSALKSVQAWLEREPNNVASRELMARIFLEQERTAEGAGYLVEGADLAAAQNDHATAAELLLRAKYLTPDSIDLRRRLIAEFHAQNDQQRAGFEIIDLAEILFASDQTDAGLELLNEHLTSDISVSLKLQMIGTLAERGSAESAREKLGQVSAEALAGGAETQAEYYELLSRLEPENVESHLKQVELLWRTSPPRAIDAACDSTQILLDHDNAQGAEKVVAFVAERLDGYIPEARRLMGLAAEANCPDLAGQIYTASIQGLAEDDQQEALKAAKWMAALDPHHPSAAPDVAYLLASQGHTGEAAAQYAKVAEILRQIGDFESGLQYAREATALDSGSVPALAAQALLTKEALSAEEADAAAKDLLNALDTVDDAAAAETGFLAATELFPDDAALLDRAAHAFEKFDKPQSAARVRARQGALLGQQGNWDEAVITLSAAVEAAPGVGEVQEQFGEACKITGDKNKAAIAFSEAALAYAKSGAMDDAGRCVTSAEVAGPESAQAWERLYAAASHVGRSETALTAARTLTALYQDEKTSAPTIQWARTWIENDSSNPVAHATLGNALARAGQTDAAGPTLAQASELYYKQGNVDQAVSVLQEVVKAGQATPADISRLQAIWKDESNFPEASLEASRLLGTALLELGAITAATEIAEKASDQVAGELWAKIARITAVDSAAADLYEKSGAAHRRAGNTTDAVTVLQEASSAGLSTPGIHRILAELLTDAQRVDEALPHQIEVLKQSTREGDQSLAELLPRLQSAYQAIPSGLAEIAHVLLIANKRDAALEILESAANEAVRSNDTAALVNICGLDEELTRQSAVLTRARADALMGMENEQQALEWVSSSTRSMMQEGQFEEALQMAERWISLRPRDAEARRQYAEACARTGREQDSADAILKLAEVLIAGPTPAAAVEVLDDLLTRQPDNLQAHSLKIESQKKAGKLDDAADSFCALANVQETSGDNEGARASFAQALALQPNHATALWKNADLTRELEGLVPALPIYRKWLRVRRESVELTQWIDDLKAVTEIAPGSSPLLKELTTVLLDEKRDKEALPFLERLAGLLDAEGDFAGAASALENALSHSASSDANQHLRLAALYEKAELPSQAQQFLRSGAQIFRQAGDDPAAIEALEQLLSLAGGSPLPEDFAAIAEAYAHSGKSERAADLMQQAFTELNKLSFNAERKEKLLAQAMQLDPLNPDYVVAHIELWPANRAMSEGLRAANEMQAAGQHENAIRVLTRVVALAPHDMSLRQQLFEPLRATKNQSRLRQELMTLASDALAAGDLDAAIEALDEVATLVKTAQQNRALAELNERARRLDEAAKYFIAAAMAFSEVDKLDQATANVNRAISAHPGAVPAETMAVLLGKIGLPIYDMAREQLRTALTARKQKQSQMLALALMSTAPQNAVQIIKTVHTLGGSTILASIAHVRIDSLLESDQLEPALDLANMLVEIAPDSPDSWQLLAKVSAVTDQSETAVRSALEAARLFAIAGAVIEEEDAYRQALDAEPDNTSIKTTFAEFLAREHRPDEAVELLQDVIQVATSSGNMDTQLEALNRAVQIAPANTDLRESLAKLLEGIAPDSAVENWLFTAAAYRDAGEHDRAQRTLKHVLDLNPGNEKALHELILSAREDADLEKAARLTTRLAEIKSKRRNIGEACRLLQSHLEIDPDNLEILEQLAAFSGASNDNEVFVTTTRALARKFQRSGDNASALQHFEKLYERSPRDMQLLTTMIDCCAASGNAEKGVEYARELMAIARQTEDPERIRLAAATILNYDSTDAEAHRELAESLLSLNRVPEAVTQFLRAAEYFESTGSNANAFTCYRKVTQINPSTTQAWRRLADLALTMNDFETARRSVLHLLESGAKSETSKVKPLVDRLVQRSGDLADVHHAAFEYYQKIDDKKSAALEALWLAQDSVVAGNADTAERQFSDALKLDPNNRDIKMAHYEFIRAAGRLEELQLRLRTEVEQHLTAGDKENAIAVLRELSTMAPGQISVSRDLAKLLEDENRHEEALKEYLNVIRQLLERSELEEARDLAETLVARYPDTSNCRELVADLLAETAYPDLAARYYSTSAEVSLQEKEYDRAIQLLQKAVQARPLWTDARNTLAATYEKVDRKEEAFQAWIDLVPVLMESGEFLEATSMLNRLSKNYPDSPEVREQLAGLYEKTGRRDEYLVTLRELATLYESNGDTQNALATYHRLCQAAPDDAGVISKYLELSAEMGTPNADYSDEYTRMADVLARSGDVDGAFQTYEQVVAQSPENTTARSRYAAFLLARGNRNRALAEMRTLAELYMQRNESTAAVEVLNAALTITPRDADLCLALARAQEAAGLTEDARISYSRASAILANTAAVKGIDTYRRILSVDPNNTAVRLRLVELLMKTDDKMEAAREARYLAEIHINHGELAEAEHAYSLVDACEPQSVMEIKEAIQRDSYDPSLQYLHYVRLGNCLFSEGDVDGALDAYRTARSLHDDQTELIQKCIDCVSLIAPEAEAIPDYLFMAEKYLLAGNMDKAREAYEKVRMIDPFNNDARCGIESVDSADARKKSGTGARNTDDLVLKASRTVNKRIALMDLMVACQQAADEGARNSDSQRLK